MTDSELLDRLIDAIELVSQAKVYAKDPKLKEFKKTVASQYRNKANHYYQSCFREARKASFKRRGILPHGANGPILFPDGTRDYNELRKLEESFTQLEDTPNL